jgi:hypothetical protein
MLLFLFLYGCTSDRSRENMNADVSDSLRLRPSFNTNEELYIVNKIGLDTVDPNGNKCKNVEMKSISGKIFMSCYQENLPEIGDSIWIGYDKSRMPYLMEYR